MEITLATPSFLFPTISLLLLAYTNRFVAINSLIRNLHKQYQENQSDSILTQIKILRRRVILIRDLQVLGILCLFFCVLTMFMIFENYMNPAKYIFAFALLLLMVSFGLAAWEIILSTRAVSIQLQDIIDPKHRDTIFSDLKKLRD